MIKHFLFFAVLILYLFLIAPGCEHRFDISSLPSKTAPINPTDTTYVEVFPPWSASGLESPRGVMIGNDQLVYVCDHDKNEVIILDAGGSVLSRKSILHPTAIAQNSKLDLYVGAETIAPNGLDTIGAVYRIFMARFDTNYVARYDTVIRFGDTVLVPEIRDTSYYNDYHLETAHMRIVWQEPGRPQRRFRGIGIMPDNTYFIARYGPDNSSFVDPDCRVMRFNANDTSDVFLTALGDLITRPSGGTAISDIRYLTGIMVFPGTRNFILTQTTDGVVYGAIVMNYRHDVNFDGWVPAVDPSDPNTAGADIIKPYRFKNAVAAAYNKKKRETFVLDAALDSVMIFTSAWRFKQESFGRFITGSQGFPELRGPMGIAYSNDCTLYISDTGNKVIRRFRLSIQTQCIQ